MILRPLDVHRELCQLPTYVTVRRVVGSIYGCNVYLRADRFYDISIGYRAAPGGDGIWYGPWAGHTVHYVGVDRGEGFFYLRKLIETPL